MGRLELQLNQIEDEVLRENFINIQENVNENPVSSSEIKVFEAFYEDVKMNNRFLIRHDFNFTPDSFIKLDLNDYIFPQDQIDDKFIAVEFRTSYKSARIKFLSGRF